MKTCDLFRLQIFSFIQDCCGAGFCNFPTGTVSKLYANKKYFTTLYVNSRPVRFGKIHRYLIAPWSIRVYKQFDVYRGRKDEDVDVIFADIKSKSDVLKNYPGMSQSTVVWLHENVVQRNKLLRIYLRETLDTARAWVGYRFIYIYIHS